MYTISLLTIPLIFIIAIFFSKNIKLNLFINILFALFHITMSTIILVLFMSHSEVESFTSYLKADSLAIIFLMVLSILNFAVSLYNIEYSRNIKDDIKKHKMYTILYILFITCMTGALLTTHIGLFWVFIEATTLASTLLIYSNKTKSALEATWKYLFLCTIGITLAFVGIILLSIGNTREISLFFEDIYKNSETIDPFWLKLSFVFIMIGFGTKVGLVPVHSWLPDAHSEAPSPVSALLSGTLLNIALLGIIRYQKIMEKSGLGNFSNTIMIIMGFLSLLIAASFLLKIKNYKRMLAYSSIENMGIITIGLSIGGIGYYAALIHLITHSLAKSSLFLTSGNILHKYGTKKIDDVKGLLKRSPADGVIFLISFLILIGIPPSLIFLSEFLMIFQFIKNRSIFLLIVFVVLIAIVIYALGKSVTKMVFGKTNKVLSNEKSSIFAYIPQIILISAAIFLGIIIPLLFSKSLISIF